jgi:hypothetical protein
MSSYLKKVSAALSPLHAATLAAATPEQPLAGTVQYADNHFRRHRRRRRGTVRAPTVALYRVADRLHEARTVEVPCNEIVSTVSAWLAELDAYSPLVEDLAQAVRACDWPAAYAIGDCLSVDVTAAAGAR